MRESSPIPSFCTTPRLLSPFDGNISNYKINFFEVGKFRFWDDGNTVNQTSKRKLARENSEVLSILCNASCQDFKKRNCFVPINKKSVVDTGPGLLRRCILKPSSIRRSRYITNDCQHSVHSATKIWGRRGWLQGRESITFSGCGSRTTVSTIPVLIGMLRFGLRGGCEMQSARGGCGIQPLPPPPFPSRQQHSSPLFTVVRPPPSTAWPASTSNNASQRRRDTAVQSTTSESAPTPPVPPPAPPPPPPAPPVRLRSRTRPACDACHRSESRCSRAIHPPHAPRCRARAAIAKRRLHAPAPFRTSDVSRLD